MVSFIEDDAFRCLGSSSQSMPVLEVPEAAECVPYVLDVDFLLLKQLLAIKVSSSRS
ncbi:MAG: hypothetical protein KDB22_02255 [Planctomycetales bacterium]|nr:hypothetical protein [Planctomycetales bacterium]